MTLKSPSIKVIGLRCNIVFWSFKWPSKTWKSIPNHRILIKVFQVFPYWILPQEQAQLLISVLGAILKFQVDLE